MDESEAWFIDVTNWNFLWDRLSQRLAMMMLIILKMMMLMMMIM